MIYLFLLEAAVVGRLGKWPHNEQFGLLLCFLGWRFRAGIKSFLRGSCRFLIIHKLLVLVQI